MPRKALPSFGNLLPRGTLFPSGPHLSVQWLSILFPHAGYASVRTGKTGTEICPGGGQVPVPVFVQRRLGKAYAEALQNPRTWFEIFVLECENRLSKVPISGIIKQSNSPMEVPLMVISYNKLWKLLIDRKMSKADLRRAAGIAPNTMTKLNRDEEVTLETLGKICGVLNVNVGDIVDIFPDVP